HPERAGRAFKLRAQSDVVSEVVRASHAAPDRVRRAGAQHPHGRGELSAAPRCLELQRARASLFEIWLLSAARRLSGSQPATSVVCRRSRRDRRGLRYGLEGVLQGRLRHAKPGSRLERRSIVTSLYGCGRSEEHTSELQSPYDLVCRLLLEKKKKH